jgi:uroporphyrinogen-III synthase
MSQAQDQHVNDLRIPTLERIAARGQVWARVAEKHGVTNPLPPWKSSLDGTCDALDRNGEALLPMLERRSDEDLLSDARYSTLPAPESQLVALAHSLVARGMIGEEALARRIAAVRTRLEAA